LHIRQQRLLRLERGITRGAAVAEAWLATRYAVVGGLAGLLYLVLAIVLERTAHIGPQAASALALTAAAAFAYVGHHTITFSADGRHGHYAPRFLTLALAAYGVSYLLIRLLVETHTAPYMIAALLVAVANAAISYLCNRLLVFRPALAARESGIYEPERRR